MLDWSFEKQPTQNMLFKTMNKIQCTALLLANVMMTSAIANPGEFDDMSALNIVDGSTKSNPQFNESPNLTEFKQSVNNDSWLYDFGSTSAPLQVVNSDFAGFAVAAPQNSFVKHSEQVSVAIDTQQLQHSDEDDGNIFIDGLSSLYNSAENLTVKVTSFVGTHFHSIFCDEEEQQPIANVESQYVYVKPSNDITFSTTYALPAPTKHQFDFENNNQGLSIFGKNFDVIYELEKHENAAHPMLNIDQEIEFEIGFSSAM